MTSLKHYERDLELPGRLGDGGLRLPSEERLRELVTERLAGVGPEAVEARLLFARWKPATSLLGTWLVRFADGSERTVSWKGYSCGKDQEVAASFRVNRHMEAGAAPLAPFAYVEEDSALLTVFPVDRVLRGAARVRDLRRTGRMLDDAGLWPGLVMRRRSSSMELLRYKPERRAVLSLRAMLKQRVGDSAQPRGAVRLGVRVLSAEEAVQVASRREQCGFEGFPKLLHIEESSGLLFEEWIEGEPFASDQFEDAAGAAGVIGRLHRQPAMGVEAVRISRDRCGVLELLSRLPEVHDLAASLPPLAARSACSWVHGDFHPDQLTRTPDGLRLLDADALRIGAPEEDLANWIADQLDFQPECSFEEASGALLTGYGERAEELDIDWCRALVIEELLARAAAGLRRLQVGAEERAERLVLRARELSTVGPRVTSAPIPDALRALESATGIEPRDVLRADLGREGDVLLETLSGGERRWFQASTGLVELHPSEDPKLPLCGRLDWNDPQLSLISWRPGRRIAFAGVESGTRVILKGLRRKRLAQAFDRYQRVYEALGGASDFVVPAVQLDEERSALKLEFLELPPVTLGAESAPAFRAIGAALRRFQEQVSLAELSTHDVAAEVDVLEQLARRHAEGMGRLPVGWEASFEQLVACSSFPPSELRAAHRDLHDGQLLASAERVGLLDFDLLCGASPLLDLGNLTAHLHLRAIQGLGGATRESATVCSESLLEGYGWSGSRVERRELRFYQAATYLRLALVYSLRPRWCEISDELMYEGQAHLDAIDVV
jgi:aminoglycoside phosphotransferase (APT) family kinase protein